MVLCEELAETICEKAGFDFVYHPLIVTMYSHSSFEIERLNKSLRLKKDMAEKSLAEKSFDRYLILHERPFRLEAFLAIADELEDAKYWELLRWLWVDSEGPSVNRDIWLELFRSERDQRAILLTEEDRDTFQAMPETLTVYRGGMDATGISWTTEIETARWFAKRFNLNNLIWEAKIQKSEVLAFFSHRSESEVVVLVDTASAKAASD